MSTTTTKGDIAVLALSLLSIGFLSGQSLGEINGAHKIATTCVPQNGEGPLIAVEQKPSGVLCIFDQQPRPGYGKGLRIRKATRS